MKTHYEKVLRDRYKGDPNEWVYTHVFGHYHRQIRTSGELRANAGLRADNHHNEDYRDFHLTPRGRRCSSLLDAWNDYHVTRNWKKSWKDFTKHRKQWMVGDDPKPVSRW